MDKIMVIKCTIHVCSILLLVWRLHPLLYLKKITSPLSPWPFLSVSRALGLFGIVTASLFHGKSKLNSPKALRLTCVGCPLATANRGSWTERPKISKATSQPRYAYKLRDFLASGPRPRLHRYRLNKQVIIFARVTEDLETHTRSPERLMWSSLLVS